MSGGRRDSASQVAADQARLTELVKVLQAECDQLMQYATLPDDGEFVQWARFSSVSLSVRLCLCLSFCLAVCLMMVSLFSGPGSLLWNFLTFGVCLSLFFSVSVCLSFCLPVCLMMVSLFSGSVLFCGIS